MGTCTSSEATLPPVDAAKNNEGALTSMEDAAGALGDAAAGALTGALSGSVPSLPSAPSMSSAGVPSLPKPSVGGVSLGGVNMAAGAAALGAAAISTEGDDGKDGEGGDKVVKEGESVTKFRRSSTQRPPDAMWTADMGKPQMKTGWAWKQGHMYKSWKKRYFVLYEGTLKYYAKYDDATGKAKNAKDSLFLKNYVFGVLPDMGNKIYIKPDKEASAGVSKDKDLLVDFYEEDGCEPEEECHTWTKALSQHILYAATTRADETSN